MPEKNRGIGSEGLEQGGPNLGNDYSRQDMGVRNAGDALTTPNTAGMSRDDDRETLDMDKESSRNLSGETAEDVDTDDTDLDDVDLDEDEDDDDLDDDEDDDDEEDDELDKGL